MASVVPPQPQAPSRIGQFIQTYHSFLSSFVIGAAGLVATSIWQYRQSEVAASQAASQQHIAQTEAENNWRIERAEILSKNLSVLSSSGKDTVEQRYGVLLSLTRGNIIDPELGVSYALELGKDNPAYMKSVLESTPEKSYQRLAAAFDLTCQQRFGFARDTPLCAADQHQDRTLAITEVIAEELDAALRKNEQGPLTLLADEHAVQNALLRDSVLFEHYLSDLFERRQWQDIERFEKSSKGARLVSAVVLAPEQPNSFVAASEANEIDKFHDARAIWLREYLFSRECTAECRGKIIDVMLTDYAEAKGRYDDTLLELFTKPRSEVAMALAHLHARLLSCQVENDDAAEIRDRILVPALIASLKGTSDNDRILREDLLSLLALTPDPDFGSASEALGLRQKWSDALAQARTLVGDDYDRAFTKRRANAQATRKDPPQKLKRGMFCTADEVSLADIAIEE